MIRKLKYMSLALFISAAPSAFSAAPMGDTQGKVVAVVVEHNANKDHNSFVVYMDQSNVQNDRWECIKNNGYIRVKSNGIGIDATNYEQIFSVALAAQVSDLTLALSSSGSSPCENVNTAFMLD